MTGDPTRDTEPTPHDFESLPVDEYTAARDERERRQRERAAREHCPDSERVDGPWHSWRFDGDDPYVICVYCGTRKDALSGRVIP